MGDSIAGSKARQDLLKSLDFFHSTRWVILAFLIVAVGITWFIGKEGSPHPPMFAIWAGAAVVNELTAFIIRRHRKRGTIDSISGRTLRALYESQYALDALGIITLLIYTGGPGSIYTFFIVFPVITSAFMGSRREIYFRAATTTVLYAGFMALAYFEILPSTHTYGSASTTAGAPFMIASTVVLAIGLMVTAFIAALLTEQWRRRESELDSMLQMTRTLMDMEDRDSTFIIADSLKRTMPLGGYESGIVALIDDSAPLRCWEEMRCAKPECPAFGVEGARCWSQPGTLCKERPINSVTEKRCSCADCRLFFEAPLQIVARCGAAENSHEGNKKAVVAITDSILGRPLMTGEIAKCDCDLELTDSEKALFGLSDIAGRREMTLYPLMTEYHAIGVMAIAQPVLKKADGRARFSETLANQLSLIIDRANLRDKLKIQAIEDGLTGLYNHRYLMHRLGEEASRAKRYGKPVTLLMSDVDNFKGFNDRYGHQTGDAVLCAIAKLIKQQFRDVDIAARFGGDEFAILFPNTGLEAAKGVVQRFESALHEMDGFGGKEGERVTMSFGLAEFPSCADTGDSLLAAADMALYEAKQLGRNRIRTA